MKVKKNFSIKNPKKLLLYNFNYITNFMTDTTLITPL